MIVSCTAGKEGQAGREAISLISEAHEEITAIQSKQNAASNEAEAKKDDDKGDDGNTTQDFSALIAEEVADLKDEKKQPFDFMRIGIGALIYVIFKYKDGPSPAEIIEHICRQAKDSKQNRTRFCTRFYPVEHTCQTSKEALGELAKVIAQKYFPTDSGTDEKTEEGSATTGIEFSVEVEKKVASVGEQLDRMEIVKLFADAVAQPPNKVNLSNPKQTILVNLMRDTSGVAVVPKYREYARYNVFHLVVNKPDQV